MEKSKSAKIEELAYESPFFEEIGTEDLDGKGAVAIAAVAILAAAVYDGIVLVNYGVAINVAGGVNVAMKVNAIT